MSSNISSLLNGNIYILNYDFEVKMGLEDKIKQPGLARRALGRIMPITAEYNYRAEVKRLQEDPEIARLHIKDEEIKSYLETSLGENKSLYTSAKIADSADKITSTLGVGVKYAATAVGAVLGAGIGAPIAYYGMQYAEEIAEMAIKMPFIIQLIQRRDFKHLEKLMMHEAPGWVPVPIINDLGNIIDIVADSYVGTAHEIIREDAKTRILEDRHEGGWGRRLENEFLSYNRLAFVPVINNPRVIR